MSDTITAQSLFHTYEVSMRLQWHYGQSNEQRGLQPESESFKAFSGFFNQLHHHQITLFGPEEIAYLNALPSDGLSNMLAALFKREPVVIIVCNEQPIPAPLLARAKRHRVALLSSSLQGQTIIDRLNHDLAAHFAKTCTRHGVFMDVLGVGVLLTGKSGVGKSELALGLINCGHRLVADDAVIFSKLSQETLIGSCPRVLQDFLEVRGLGIINIRAMFGDNAIKESKRLQLIVKVVAMEHEELQNVDRLEGIHDFKTILDIRIPEVTIPVAPGRNLAVLVEGAVRNQILKLTGYEASKEFIQRQLHTIEDNQS